MQFKNDSKRTAGRPCSRVAVGTLTAKVAANAEQVAGVAEDRVSLARVPGEVVAGVVEVAHLATRCYALNLKGRKNIEICY